MVVYCYRYMWTVGNSRNVNFRIVTDVPEGLSQFEKNLISQVPNLSTFGREYLCEYDSSKLVHVENLLNKEVK